MHSFLFGFPHCSRQLCSPWALRTTTYTPDKSAQAEKKYQGTKALYAMLSSCIDFFSASIFDRQHKIVASCHVKLGLRDRVGSASIIQFTGVNVSWTRHCGVMLTVSNSFWMCLLPLHSGTHKNCSTESKPRIQVSFVTKLCALDHMAVSCSIQDWVCFYQSDLDGWIQRLKQHWGAG